MPSLATELRQVMLDDILEHVRSRVDADRLPAAEALSRSYFAGLFGDDPTSIRPEAVADAVLSLLELAQLRRPGQANVRIFNPPHSVAGVGRRHTVIEIVNDDMPFLVDSVAAALSSHELDIHHLVHPQMAVVRDGNRLEAYLDPTSQDAEGLPIESLMQIEINQQGAAAGPLRELQEQLQSVLDDIRIAVDDYPAMVTRVADIVRGLQEQPPSSIDGDALVLGTSFLAWALEDHFTFLGCCDYELIAKEGRSLLEPVPDTALGIVKRGELRRNKISSAKFLAGDELLRITKSTRRSTVHRPVHMDLIAVKWTGADGEVKGERRILGLFTSRAYSIAVSDIPLLDRKVANVLARADYLPRSHDYKALRAILERYPRDELFQISEDNLFRFAPRILSLQLRPRTALLVRYDEASRYASCMVFVPRERHNTEHRLRIQGILEASFQGQVTAFYTRLSDSPLAQLHFVVRLRGKHRSGHNLREIEARIAAVTRSWSDELKQALVARLGEEAGLAEWRRYRAAFPVAFHDDPDSVANALADMPLVERTVRKGRIALRLDRPPDMPENAFFMRTCERGDSAPLSRYVPVLENLGLEARSETPFKVCPEDAREPIWIRAFDLRAPHAVDVEAVERQFRDAFVRIWSGAVEDDPFNRLVIGAGLSWRQVVVLRAYARYLQQVGLSFSQRYTAETLVKHAGITRALLELFDVQFDPARQEPAANERAATVRADIRRELDGVKRVDEDRMLRRFLRLIENTLRTNYFQRTEAGNPKSYLSFKLDTRAIPGLPQPRPQFEIFVYSPRFEAVHLRGGQVARGGIRWSDRREDYRTEILGLVKAQMVKNAVIVPVGAKGGFVLTRPPAGRDELMAEARVCYQSMMRGLLDLTDNYRDGAVVPPPDVVRRDDDDPYLVVAADKGTATFSDLANAVAAEYDFWLGDAFASGGSAGYDHKKMGITARGAWESVKEHFRADGIDVAVDPITCVGVGDMSGDVFGNGMLLSRSLRLLGAFNHLHIFVDPDPDPEVAFAERQRLFALARGSWDAYDTAKLSPGGAVFDRQAKQLEISREVKERFGLRATTVTPAELMRAILKLDVDLLWFGGIGTYVKARTEVHAQVGDRANDELRLDAEQVRAKVIGEGANLGVTQAARIAFALRGGRINTDFIDNAGGVDCSDHEVNIKIALAGVVADGRMDLGARDVLLESMTDEVAALVLRDNHAQARALSWVASRSAEMVDEHQSLMAELEQTVKLDRQLEGLPDDTELAKRERGLTRPELAVLLAYAKIAIKGAAINTDLPDHPRLAADLVRYFPAPMTERLAGEVHQHRLRREIISTTIANNLVNRVGPAFAHRHALNTGSTLADVARAFIAARDIFDARTLWDEIDKLDGHLPLRVQMDMTGDVASLLDRGTRWLLRHRRDLELEETVETFHEAIRGLGDGIEEFLPARTRDYLRRRTQTLWKQGVARRFAARIAALPVLPAGFDIVQVSRAADVTVEQVARVYFLLGERFAFDRLRRVCRRLKVTDRWQRQAVADAVEELQTQQARLTLAIVEQGDNKPRQAISAWIEANPASVARFDRMITAAEGRAKIGLTQLTVMTQELRRLVTS